MQRATAERLRSEWDGATCPHPLLDNEYESGSQTGNLVCLICGRAFDEGKMLIVFYFPFLLAACAITNSFEIIKILLEYS